jgi:hypothetical protein
VIGLAGCGTGEQTADEAAPFNLSWTFTPSPTTAVPSEEDFDWAAPYRVTLTETGGEGGQITNVIVNVYENVNGSPGAQAAASTELELPTARIEARSTMELDFLTHYTLASGERAALIDVFISVVDDRSYTGQVGRRLEVQ